ncbi:hypothetical protein [Paenimyroides baculatum]|uniref:Uncharacterized protein n=1 Tax=Paenimyroides baculatum TaxID=2608000 RepID=A0A5M6CCK2_9FLAO|nr:hypothetical protein [Paenimyroides baculatum]KAA5532791.1 hypothetical protein F0460_13175 [Paenimyroides baculatum]
MKKYQYHVKVWGGFFNSDLKKEHNYESGDYIFDTKEERHAFLNNLIEIEKQLKVIPFFSSEGAEDLLNKVKRTGTNTTFMYNLTEGFNCDVATVLHRITEFNGEQVYTTLDMGINYPYKAAKKHLQKQWYPGFNDYPFGDNFDYGFNDVKTVSEWITGAFTPKY